MSDTGGMSNRPGTRLMFSEDDDGTHEVSVGGKTIRANLLSCSHERATRIAKREIGAARASNRGLASAARELGRVLGRFEMSLQQAAKAFTAITLMFPTRGEHVARAVLDPRYVSLFDRQPKRDNDGSLIGWRYWRFDGSTANVSSTRSYPRALPLARPEPLTTTTTPCSERSSSRSIGAESAGGSSGERWVRRFAMRGERGTRCE